MDKFRGVLAAAFFLDFLLMALVGVCPGMNDMERRELSFGSLSGRFTWMISLSCEALSDVSKFYSA